MGNRDLPGRRLRVGFARVNNVVRLFDMAKKAFQTAERTFDATIVESLSSSSKYSESKKRVYGDD